MSQSDGGYGDVQAEGKDGFAYKVLEETGQPTGSSPNQRRGQGWGWTGVVRTHKYKETKVVFKLLQKKTA